MHKENIADDYHEAFKETNRGMFLALIVVSIVEL